MSEYILENSNFYETWEKRNIDGKDINGNNYMYSNVRAWLNGLDGSNYNVENYEGKGFLDIAFTESEKAFINTTLVDNSASTTAYEDNWNTCENTNDKVYLLSYQDIINAEYGFSNNAEEYDTTRIAIVSEYARTKGAYFNDNGYYFGNCQYWLRSPSTGDSSWVTVVYYHGGVDVENYVGRSQFGVRPGLQITIE